MKISQLTLDEVIRAYELEMSRKNSLESKASALLNTSAIVISIVNGIIAIIVVRIITFNNSEILVSLNIIAIVLIMYSLFYSLKILKVKKLLTPFEVTNPSLFKKELDMGVDTLQENLIDRYVSIIPDVYNQNEVDIDYLNRSRNYLILGIGVSILGLIITIGLITRLNGG